MGWLPQIRVPSAYNAVWMQNCIEQIRTATNFNSKLPVYANNAAAVAGGLVVGAYYRTGADPDAVCVVH